MNILKGIYVTKNNLKLFELLTYYCTFNQVNFDATILNLYFQRRQQCDKLIFSAFTHLLIHFIAKVVDTDAALHNFIS